MVVHPVEIFRFAIVSCSYAPNRRLILRRALSQDGAACYSSDSKPNGRQPLVVALLITSNQISLPPYFPSIGCWFQKINGRPGRP